MYTIHKLKSCLLSRYEPTHLQIMSNLNNDEFFDKAMYYRDQESEVRPIQNALDEFNSNVSFENKYQSVDPQQLVQHDTGKLRRQILHVLPM